jgi:hypothetical protein
MTLDEFFQRPRRPIDDLYAELLEEHPDNVFLWQRVLDRATDSVEPPQRPWRDPDEEDSDGC